MQARLPTRFLNSRHECARDQLSEEDAARQSCLLHLKLAKLYPKAVSVVVNKMPMMALLQNVTSLHTQNAR